MSKMRVQHDVGGISGLCLIEPKLMEDERGYFMETFNRLDMEREGLCYSFVQHNQSKSLKGVLRGLHFQKRYPQTKLIRVIKGEIFDVAVDMREASETYAKWYGQLLSEENKYQLLIPRGFAHGFLVLSEEAQVCYLADEFYHPEDEGGIAWNDPGIGIVWPGVEGKYSGNAGAAGYLFDNEPLVINERDQRFLRMTPPAITYPS